MDFTLQCATSTLSIGGFIVEPISPKSPPYPVTLEGGGCLNMSTHYSQYTLWVKHGNQIAHVLLIWYWFKNYLLDHSVSILSYVWCELCHFYPRMHASSQHCHLFIVPHFLFILLIFLIMSSGVLLLRISFLVVACRRISAHLARFGTFFSWSSFWK